jgi:hypothetical protein
MGNSFSGTLLILQQWFPVGKMIVRESSATLEYPGERRLGLNGNHLTIAKYSSKRDPNFVTVATTLRKLVTDAVNVVVVEVSASEVVPASEAL